MSAIGDFMNHNIATLTKPKQSGFTIVELLVVIVVIGILAAITVVSYTGLSNKANVAVMQSDLSNSSNQLKMYQATYGSYPTSLGTNNCPSAPTADSSLCLKTSSSNVYTDYISNGTAFSLSETSSNGTTYNITDNQSPIASSLLSPANWITIGTQTWAKANLNVGTKVSDVTGQTNNSVLEKYCYNNDEANCTAYGGLYQWDEAMQYSASEKAQGICPAGSHIPTDAEWTTLKTYLGSSTAGLQLKSGGTSGFNLLLAGMLPFGSAFDKLSTGGYLWSSTKSNSTAWLIAAFPGFDGVTQYTNATNYGFSVRCIGN